jgi:hypothetical protein
MKIEKEIEIKEIEKVKERVSLLWFKKPWQINSQILIAFLKLRDKQDVITPEDIKMKCPEIKGFEGNYNQMKNFGDKNHGKVFEENSNGEVELWSEVKDFILKEYKEQIL